MNLEQARHNMIEQQIRTWEVLDQNVLKTLVDIRREAFVPKAYQSLAFVDTEIPLPCGQQMLSPKLEARLLQGLECRAASLQAGVGRPRGAFLADAGEAIEDVGADGVGRHPRIVKPGSGRGLLVL